MAQGQGDSSELTVSWLHSIDTRDGTLTTDAKLVNCYGEEGENGPSIRKRPGTSYLGGSASGTAQGQFLPYNTQATPEGFYIVNDVIKSYDGLTSVTITGASSAHLPYSVSPNVAVSGNFLQNSAFLQSCGIPISGFSGGAWLFNGNTATVTKVTDANYPATTVPGTAYLDGVMYVMGVSGKIQGSALN